MMYGQEIRHLLYMDDLKLYGKTMEIGMKFNLENVLD